MSQRYSSPIIEGLGGQELRPSINSHVSEPSWKGILSPSEIFKTAGLAHSLTTASGKTLSQNHPAKLPLNSWPLETM